MNGDERGSEMVQAVFAVPLVLFVVFAVFQVGAMMLSVNRLTADMTRACRQMDTAGLALALDKETFVKAELLGSTTQLEPELLHIARVSLVVREDELVSESTSLGEGQPADTIKATSSLSQRTQVAEVSFEVRYELPFLAEIPGLMHTTIARYVECSLASNRIVEVEVAAL